jgi:hypothetical protein
MTGYGNGECVKFISMKAAELLKREEEKKVLRDKAVAKALRESQAKLAAEGISVEKIKEEKRKARVAKKKALPQKLYNEIDAAYGLQDLEDVKKQKPQKCEQNHRPLRAGLRSNGELEHFSYTVPLVTLPDDTYQSFKKWRTCDIGSVTSQREEWRDDEVCISTNLCNILDAPCSPSFGPELCLVLATRTRYGDLGDPTYWTINTSDFMVQNCKKKVQCVTKCMNSTGCIPGDTRVIGRSYICY